MGWRARFIFLLFLTTFLGVLLRLFYWQIIFGDDLRLIAAAQHQEILPLNPLRGEIKTSDNFSLVSNNPAFLLFAKPKEIEDKKELAGKLANILKIDSASISANLSRDLNWVPIKTKVDIDTKAQIEKLKRQELGFERQYTRFYPEASLASHLVGFVGKDERGSDRGYFGIEGFYDNELRGRGGRLEEVKDARGRPILLGRATREEKIDGRTLVLHLNRRIQFAAQQKLKEGVEKYGAKSGTAMVMNPKTGGILAWASYPNYDPQTYYDYGEDFFRDPAIADTYEPGSTFKIFIMAAALNEEAVTPQTNCDSCQGPVTIGDYTIRNWNDKYFPNTSMIDVITHSDNTGMTFVSKKLGLDKLYSYLEKFRIGNLSGIDLQGETTQELRPKDEWYPIDLATASFGQGVAVTPIQMLVALTSLANGGKIMEPHVVSKIIDDRGNETLIQPKVLREVISPTNARIITEMMINAVEQGEAKWTKLPGYRIAGKTGTAQIPIAGHYDPDRTIASFVGFGPADDPQFAMLVRINEPKTSLFGSETAAPIFFKIAREILNYYNIPPRE